MKIKFVNFLSLKLLFQLAELFLVLFWNDRDRKSKRKKDGDRERETEREREKEREFVPLT